MEKLLDLLVDRLHKADNTVDKVQLKEELQEAVREHRFSFIKKNGIDIGFFTWIIPNSVDLVIYINNLYIEEPFRNRFNLLFLRRYFKNKYPNCSMFYWHKYKTQSYVYFK